MILSPPSAVYGQTAAIRIAVCALMAIPIIAILTLAGSPPRGEMLAVIAAIVAATIWLCVLIGKTQITIHEEGIRRTSHFGVTEIEWREVREYRYRLVPISHSGAFHAGGLIGAAIVAASARDSRGMNLYFKLIANDGRTVQVSSNFKNAKEAIARILRQIHPAMQKRVNQDLDLGGATFGDVRLSRRTVQWKEREPIVLSDITKAEIKGTRLSIRKRGKMFDAISAPAYKVPNVLLLLETMEMLGVAKNEGPGIDPLARVR